MYALVDGNNFYVSCECVFRPALNGHPVVVASNNDGCAIARNDLAKSIGVKMGHPLFKMRSEFPDAGIVTLSANFVLYGDMSNRLMGVAAGLGPKQEIYSIDEFFVDVADLPGDLTKRCRAMRDRLLQWLGLPCGIGIGSTKTLSKLANHVAKTATRKPGSYPAEFAGVCNLAALPASDLDAVFQATPVGEIWGIGPRIAAQLEALDIRTVLDLIRIPPATIRSRWSVVLERTVRELQGQPCIELEDIAPSKQQIACTRSFGHPVTDFNGLVQAVSEFASRTGEKLRAQRSRAGQMLVFIHTSPFRKQDRQYSNSITVPLLRPSSDTLTLVKASTLGLTQIFKPGYRYAKAGVMLLDLIDQHVEQGELDFGTPDDAPDELMGAVDDINDRYGKGTIRVGSAGAQSRQRVWEMTQEFRTPQYTTNWADIPLARC